MKLQPLIFLSLLSLLWLTPQALAQAPGELEIEVDATPPSAPARAAPTGAAQGGAPPAGAPTGALPGAVAQPSELPPPPAASAAEVEALRVQLAALEQRLAASEAARVDTQRLEEQRSSEAERARDADRERSLRARVAKLGVTLSGYIQAQYGQSQLSDDQLLPGGTPLNQDRFSIRRGRLRLIGRWKYARADFELDASTTRGPTASVRRAAVGAVLPSSDATQPPLLTLQFGLTEIPFGLELQQGQDEILFFERTTGSLAFFPGPIDTGVKLDAAYGPFRAQIAIMNGFPLDDRAGGPSGIDPARAPDYVGRLGFETLPTDSVRVAGGVSFLTGKGFHAGSDATKSVLQWDDSNADGVINAGELVAVAGRGAIPSETFDHWAVGADFNAEFRSKIGWTRLFAEAVFASNLDRSLYVADPIAQGDDLREINWYVAATQDLTEWSFVGLRYEVYDPNSDLADSRRGQSIPTDASLTTISPIVGARFEGLGRLTFQYDVIDDKLARDTRGVPTDVKNNQWTLRAQGEF
jgi:hypothetical protein